MSDLSDLHEKINQVNSTLSHFTGVFETSMKHVATKEFVAEKISDIKQDITMRFEICQSNHKPKTPSIIPKPDNKLTELIAKLVGAVVLLAGVIAAILQFR